MRRRLLPRLLALLLALPLVSACAGEAGAPTAAAPEPCGGRDEPAAGAPTELPLGLPLTAGSTVLRVETQGKTTIAYAVLAGDRDQLAQVRDTVLVDLRAKGYTVVGTDAEQGFEAEAELAGTRSGTLQVTPLCQDVVQLRYKING